MGSEYTLIYMNMANCAGILNMSKSAEIYPNVGNYASICEYGGTCVKDNVPKYTWMCLSIMCSV